MNKKLLTFLITIISFQYAVAQRFINSNDPRITYTGRIIMSGDSTALSWSANSIRINFTGTGIKAMLKDERGENYLK